MATFTRTQIHSMARRHRVRLVARHVPFTCNDVPNYLRKLDRHEEGVKSSGLGRFILNETPQPTISSGKLPSLHAIARKLGGRKLRLA